MIHRTTVVGPGRFGLRCPTCKRPMLLRITGVGHASTTFASKCKCGQLVAVDVLVRRGGPEDLAVHVESDGESDQEDEA